MLEEQRRLEREGGDGGASPFAGLPFRGLLEAMMGGGGWTRTLEYNERTGRRRLERPRRHLACRRLADQESPLRFAGHGNICSMTSDGSVYERFRRALNAGRLLQAMAEARDIPRMPLSDALELCLLLESNDDPRYERAAARWVGRFALECRRAEPPDLRRALDAFHALPDPAARGALVGLATMAGR